jgi:hypothetical protein
MRIDDVVEWFSHGENGVRLMSCVPSQEGPEQGRALGSTIWRLQTEIWIVYRLFDYEDDFK